MLVSGFIFSLRVLQPVRHMRPGAHLQFCLRPQPLCDPKLARLALRAPGQPKTPARQRAAERSVDRREAFVANSNPSANNLKPRRSFMFQLTVSALVSHQIPGISGNWNLERLVPWLAREFIGSSIGTLFGRLFFNLALTVFLTADVYVVGPVEDKRLIIQFRSDDAKP